jgi:hypothetical protein
MRRLVVAATVLAIVCVLGLAVFGAHQLAAQGRGGGNKWWESDRAREALDLSAEQTEALATLNQAYFQRLSERRPDVTRAMRRLITALDDPEASPEKIAVLRGELEQAWVGFARLTMDHWGDLRGELTTEQWQTLPNVAPGGLRLGMFTVRLRQPRSQG